MSPEPPTTIPVTSLDELSINTLRFLSVDAVQKANSGHPGLPLGAARVKRAGKEFVGDQRELYLLDEQPGKETPYERLLSDAMAGDSALFTREDAVEVAWVVVDPVLGTHHRTHPYKPGSWGPKQADALMAADGSWHNPILVKATK